ncbi:uncharacterized protein LOC127277871 [Leptopilina boulardi]|uniref:uncharacterized protein LOC127277871 n=1 Tax=Leptopilina boulardi TaxID=63433 RepID=UPI0021F5777C|nr:uncharacterized protein LOC127277871 [Leptopilina boulardi]
MFAYVKYLDSCPNKVKHKDKQIVPVEDIINFQKYEKNNCREFRIKCGEKLGLGLIGLVGESKKDVEDKLLNGPRPKFATISLRKENSDLKETHQNNKTVKQRLAKELKGKDILAKRAKLDISKQEPNKNKDKKSININKSTRKEIEGKNHKLVSINREKLDLSENDETEMDNINGGPEKSKPILKKVGEENDMLAVIKTEKLDLSENDETEMNNINRRAEKSKSVSEHFTEPEMVDKILATNESQDHYAEKEVQVPNSVPKDREVNNNSQNTTQSNNRVKLERYSIVNNQIYLGGGVLFHKNDWEVLKKKSKNSLWLLGVIRIFWPKGFENRCVDSKRLRVGKDGETLKPLSPRKIKTIQKLYRDRLKGQNITGKLEVREKLKDVRRKLTQQINDFKKIKEQPSETNPDMSDDSSDLE